MTQAALLMKIKHYSSPDIPLRYAYVYICTFSFKHVLMVASKYDSTNEKLNMELTTIFESLFFTLISSLKSISFAIFSIISIFTFSPVHLYWNPEFQSV